MAEDIDISMQSRCQEVDLCFAPLINFANE